MHKPVLIAALSGRALAASARRAGFAPLVADFFGDADTLDVAHAHRRLTSGLARGIDDAELFAALEELANGHPVQGIVCGTGFEDRPHLLAALAERWPLLGNGAEVMTAVKDPASFATLCHGLRIPHPALSLEVPLNPADWLAKRRGGSGGSHVTPAAGREANGSTYFQRHVPGTPVSALFLAAGSRAVVLGFSAQWSCPEPHRPFRYGGAVRPADVPPGTAAAIASAVEAIVADVPLVGLNSADFLVDGDAFWLMEVNPRPGATLDIFEPAGGSLFALHVAACGGELPAVPPRMDDASAAAIAYADQNIASLAPLDWPDWTADRPHSGLAVTAGDPLCTVLARGPTAADARALVSQRLMAVLAWTRGTR